MTQPLTRCREFQIGVDIRRGPRQYRVTRVVTFVSRYQLDNRTPYTLTYAQRHQLLEEVRERGDRRGERGSGERERMGGDEGGERKRERERERERGREGGREGGRKCTTQDFVGISRPTYYCRLQYLWAGVNQPTYFQAHDIQNVLYFQSHDTQRVLCFQSHDIQRVLYLVLLYGDIE